jgi:hypothetical protein
MIEVRREQAGAGASKRLRASSSSSAGTPSRDSAPLIDEWCPHRVGAPPLPFGMAGRPSVLHPSPITPRNANGVASGTVARPITVAASAHHVGAALREVVGGSGTCSRRRPKRRTRLLRRVRGERPVHWNVALDSGLRLAIGLASAGSNRVLLCRRRRVAARRRESVGRPFRSLRAGPTGCKRGAK